MEANDRQLNNFEENIAKFKRNLIDRGYPEMLIQETLSEVKYSSNTKAKRKQTNLAFWVLFDDRNLTKNTPDRRHNWMV